MKISQRMLSLLFCAILLINILTPPPAEAIAGELTLAAFALTGLVAAGLVFSDKEEMTNTVNSFVGGLSQTVKDAMTTQARSGNFVWDAITGRLKFIGDMGTYFLDNIKSWVDANFNVGSNETTESEYVPFSFPYIIPAGTTNFKHGVNDCRFEVFYSGGWKLELYVNDVREFQTYNPDDSNNFSFRSSGTYAYAYRQEIKLSSNAFVVEYLSLSQVISSASITGTDAVDAPAHDFPDEDRSISFIPDLNADGTLNLDEDGNIQIDYEATQDALIDATYDDVFEQDLSGIPLTASEASSIGVPIAVDYPTAEYPTIDTANENWRSLLFTKFPFCLPWDLKNAINLIASDYVEAPHWEIDLMAPIEANFGVSFGSDTTWKIDMADFPIVGEVFRWTSTVGFCIALIVLTRKIINS